VLTIVVLTLLANGPFQDASTVRAPEQKGQNSWSGCVQAASAPSAFRLNLDVPGMSAQAPEQPPGQGEPYVQLVPSRDDQDFQAYVGKRVRVIGRRLSVEEAEQQAAKRPDRQEASESAAGTGGSTQRHLTYVRVVSIVEVAGECP
jgi:hypothetical protein